MGSGPEHAREQAWNRWGDPAHQAALGADVRSLLRSALGVSEDTPSLAESDVELPSSRLPDGTARALSALVGDAHLQSDPAVRLRHTRGKSTLDLLRIRAGDTSDAPDAVLSPGSAEETVEVLRLCSKERVAVVPFGGGTSVTGGLGAERGELRAVVALDLTRLDRLLHLDPLSSLATLQPGIRTPEADAMLAAHGVQLGHQPQSYEYATLGGYAATRSSGQASSGYGRFDELVEMLELATPQGLWRLGRAPAVAAGPDLRQLVLGSEGAFGIITAITARVRELPERRSFRGWRFASFEAGCDALRSLAQRGPRPTVLRLSDEAETAIGLARASGSSAGPSESGCLAIVGHEGAESEVRERAAACERELLRAGGEPLGTRPGEEWERARYSAPYLRDALLDAGAFVETVETATFWSRVPDVYSSVREALTSALAGPSGRPALVLCHVSHVYPTGASLYFTVLAAQEPDPQAQWRRLKRAASDAIVAAGATISHHHGVGRDHRPWLEAEIGELGVRVLRAIKRELDPAGILNPGVLIP